MKVETAKREVKKQDANGQAGRYSEGVFHGTGKDRGDKAANIVERSISVRRVMRWCGTAVEHASDALAHLLFVQAIQIVGVAGGLNPSREGAVERCGLIHKALGGPAV